MNKHLSFPDIIQFRQAIKAVQHKIHFIGLDPNGDPIYDSMRPLPTIKYRGTIKLHGSNSAICRNTETGEISVQSREQIISIENDNYGFAKFVSNIDVEKLFSLVKVPRVLPSREIDSEDEIPYIVIYGEWCGGSIQKGVAIINLEKMFVIFAAKYRGIWLPESDLKEIKIPEQRIFNILDYPSFELDIDFQHPELFQNKMIEITQGVEQECPFAKAFGVVGIGEGVVYKPVDPSWNSSKYWFKVKGKQHSVSGSKVKVLVPIDIEKLNSVKDFVEYAVTENRLKQGIEQVFICNSIQPNQNRTGDFIRWIIKDVLKEEMDTLTGNKLEPSDVNRYISNKAKNWFFSYLNREIGL